MRRTMRAVRNNIPPEVRDKAAERVAAGGVALLGADTGVVAGYYPIRSEMNCLPLLEHLATDGWRTALPVVPADNGALIFRAWAPGAPLSQGKFGIPEPAANAPIVQPSVVLVPLLAFDAAGRRLGYGGGYYDKTIARCAGSVTAIGLAFDEQEVAQVPAEIYDQRLDWILSPSGARPCRDKLPA